MRGAVFLGRGGSGKCVFIKSNKHAIIDSNKPAQGVRLAMNFNNKLIDWGMLAIFILWLALTDFKEADALSWFAGLSVFAYLVYNAVRRWRK